MNPKHFKLLACLSASGFMLVWILWPTLWAPSRFASLLMLPLAIPGLLALPGMFKGKAYTHAWSTLAVTCYMAWCAMEAYVNLEARPPAVAGLALGAAWFVASNLYVRGQRRQA